MISLTSIRIGNVSVMRKLGNYLLIFCKWSPELYDDILGLPWLFVYILDMNWPSPERLFHMLDISYLTQNWDHYSHTSWGYFLIYSGHVIIDINTLHRLFVRCYLWIINSTWFVFKQTLMSRYHSEILFWLMIFGRYLWLSVTDHRWNNTASVRAGVCVWGRVRDHATTYKNTTRKTQLIQWEPT